VKYFHSTEMLGAAGQLIHASLQVAQYLGQNVLG
jgi:hypothetical protein